MSTQPLHVLIIGAGTGGLCLAQGLKQAGISVAVYERDRTRINPLQGFRVGIGPDGIRGLRANLPPELFETFLATCARPPLYLNMLTEQMKELMSLESTLLTGDPDPARREHTVSRMTMRQVLLSGLEDIVHFDKTFTHYEQHDDGTVMAFFADGSSATGTVLVAADGANSRVRRQYLPHATLVETGLLSAGAKVPMTPENVALVSEKVLKGMSMIFAPRGVGFILHMVEFPWRHDGQLKPGIGVNEAEVLAQWPGMLYDNESDYIGWGLWAPRQQFPRDPMNLRGEELVAVIREMTSSWHPSLHTLIAHSDPSTALPVNIRTSQPIVPWPTTNVTLLGDAIHTMTPGRGAGANTALRDARLLCKQLVAAHDGQQDLLTAIHGYEEKMQKYGAEAVKQSLAQMDPNAPINKPVIGTAIMTTQRTMLRAVNHLPPAKRAVARAFSRGRGADRQED
ncbi:oxidoreductase [Ktedonobacter sp. SOSP1-85]|uniref:FAD-dependent oxidoreductase n=1 Tax=Ktedonobacter sp. SOSP1-85 TaxID=2778367 RepID=UPI001914DE20|nr:NAD(P)/FAD-dependent oxidoreductase [Ktedonobacter sp. SOSP1-85]GHO77826.1 oxidoreductase [Ktedonobacter sp. SOSP1-85]